MVLSLGRIEIGAWQLGAPGAGGLVLVDELARVALAARRLGWTIRLWEPGSDLTELLDLAGLVDVVGSVEVGGDAEDGEEVGVEEVVVPDDPVL